MTIPDHLKEIGQLVADAVARPPTADDLARYFVEHIHGIDMDQVGEVRGEMVGDALHIHVSYESPVEYITINLTEVGKSADGEAQQQARGAE